MRRALLRLLKIPERPAAPPGSTESLEVFRASRRFLSYSRLQWATKQVGGVFGLVFSLSAIRAFGSDVTVEAAGLESALKWLNLRFGAIGLPADVTVLDLLELFEFFAIGLFAIQLVASAALITLRWQLRWYMVSDTSVRIREGLFRVREQTMTVANIQNMTVRQGPLQRLLGIADLEVETAGGGSKGDGDDSDQSKKGLHVGRFRGLEHAEKLRDRLRSALARHRDAGLGDPDDRSMADHQQGAATLADPRVAGIVRAMLEESRRLRQSLEAAS